MSTGSAPPASDDDDPGIVEIAGEYVLGTLSAARREAVRQRLAVDAELRAAVQEWEERLLPLTALSDAVEPSPRLWGRIMTSVEQASAGVDGVPSRADRIRPSPPARWAAWRSLAFWRSLSAAGFAAAAVLAGVLFVQIQQPAQAPRYLVVLVAPQDKAPGWVVQAGANRDIQLIPLGTAPVPQHKALQFWTKADDWSGPVSLGLVTPGQTLRIPMDRLPPMQDNQLFELTLEPPSGSPSGKPTGPIQFIGRAVRVM